jgi:2,5-furandicarboxylate decarboxylase 1
MPIPTHNEFDSGPYITAGLLISRNPKTGIQNVTIHRLQLIEPNRLGVLLLPRHTLAFFQMAEAAGHDLDIAIAVGVDPLTLLSSQAILSLDADELEVAGALHGAPLEVVKCLTNNVCVPAHSEFVLEGRILAKERELEGPFGEFPQYYGERAKRHVIEIDCVVQMKKRSEGEAKNVILGALGGHYDIKQVVVVDEDVDIHNPTEVEWAVATRFQADRDLIVVSNAQGSKLDPSSRDGISAKMGLDATVPLDASEFKFTRIQVPGERDVDLRTSIDNDTAVVNWRDRLADAE